MNLKSRLNSVLFRNATHNKTLEEHNNITLDIKVKHNFAID